MAEPQYGFWTAIATRLGTWMCGCPALLACRPTDQAQCPRCGYLRPEALR